MPSAPVSSVPTLPARLLRALLPLAERDEVLDDLAAEHAARATRDGRAAASRWLWRQALGSVPALVGRSWWKGWSGFEPRANAMRPGGPMLESWLHDLRFAVRRLRTRPRHAVLAVLTLALGVGGTAAVFGLVRGLLFAPLPLRAERELGIFWSAGDWSQAELLWMRENGVPGFGRVAGYFLNDVTLRVGSEPTRLVHGVVSTAELFDVLGTRPLLGPGFTKGDDLQGGEPRVVISHGLWQELGGDARIVGQRLQLDGAPRTVVGVMPRGFWFPEPSVRFWSTTPLSPRNRSGNYALVGRVEPGVSLDRVGPYVARFTAALGQRFTYPKEWDKTKHAVVTPVRQQLVGSLRPALLATLGAMAVILLMACANVAALMLGQMDLRATEMAVRTALGADRRRLAQQLVIEALVIGVGAGIAGALLAAGGFRLLVAALPLGAWGEAASPGWPVIAAALAIAMVASLAVALFPALSLRRGELRAVIGAARTGGVAARGGRMESALVIGEVALAVLLTSGAALLVRSVRNLYAVSPGIETRGIAVLDVVTGSDLRTPQRRQAFADLVRELGTLPGVRAAASTIKLPLRGSGQSWGFGVEGRPETEQSTTYFRIVSRDYFTALGMRLKEGRGFDASDRAIAEGDTTAEPAVVINEALERTFFPEGHALGSRVATGYGGWGRVVGVVATAAEANLTDDPAPARYMLQDQVPFVMGEQTLVLRLASGGDATALLDAARRTVARVTPTAAVREATTMASVFDRAVGASRQVMWLLALLTGLALVLGAVGIYGVISHFASRRTRDWGIRIALGMLPSSVVRQVVGHGAALIAIGAVMGVAGAVALRRVLVSFLYGVAGTDALALGAAVVALLGVGVVAALLPARRASRTDPALVLREQ